MLKERLEKLFKRIRYKKGWRLHCGYLDHTEAMYLQWVFEVRKPKPGMVRGRKWYVSRHATDSEIVQTCLMAAIACEEHETREVFKVDGVNCFGPHFDVDDLVQLAKDGGSEAGARVPLPVLED